MIDICSSLSLYIYIYIYIIFKLAMLRNKWLIKKKKKKQVNI